MGKLTAQEIIKKLEEYFNKIGEDISAFAFEDYDDKEIGLGPIKEVDQYGGEGMGDEWYSVKYFEDHDIYLQVDGFYASHYGTDFDGWDSVKEVKLIKKEIVVYE